MNFAALVWTLASGGYRPFIWPAPVWNYWYLLLPPLCLGIAIVYKSIRCDQMKRVPRESIQLCCVILAVMCLAGLGLWLLTEWVAASV